MGSLFFSDLHLRPRTWARRPQIYGDSYFAWKQLQDFAIGYRFPSGERITHVLAGGDLTDTPTPDVFTQHAIRAGLDRLEEANIRFYYCLGQHDMGAGISNRLIDNIASAVDIENPPRDWWGVHPHAVHLESAGPFPVPGLGLVAGLDYRRSDLVEDALRGIPQCQTLLTHQCWADFGLRDAVARFSMAHCRNILTGDYHVHNVIDRDGDPPQTIWSPGSMCLQNLGEDPVKRFFTFSADGAPYGTHLLRSRPFYSLTLDGLGHAQQTLNWFLAEGGWPEDETLPEPLRRPIVVLEYRGDSVEYAAVLEENLREKVHYFGRFPGDADQETERDVVVDDPDPGDARVRSLVTEYVTDRFGSDDPRAALAMQLYLSQDPRRALAEMISELFHDGEKHASRP